MEKAETPPKRPATAFFKFREKEQGKGNAMGGKEAGEKWRGLKASEKKKFQEEYRQEREKFDSYLEEQGLTPRASSKKKPRSLVYKGSRVRAVCGSDEQVKDLTATQYKALGHVAVLKNLLMQLGRIREGLRNCIE